MCRKGDIFKKVGTKIRGCVSTLFYNFILTVYQILMVLLVLTGDWQDLKSYETLFLNFLFFLCTQKHEFNSSSLKYRYSHSVTGSLKILDNDHRQDTSNRYLSARILFSCYKILCYLAICKGYE